MFDKKSRYYDLPSYVVADSRGREVEVVPATEAPVQTLLGHHLVRDGQRPDQLAWRYLDDAAGYWRLAELNDSFVPEVLGTQRELRIPSKD